MENYRLTLIGLALAIVVLLGVIIGDVDLFERLVSFLNSMEYYEVDELIIPALILLLFSSIDQFRRRKAQEIEIEKIKIYKAMLSSTHHILNNFLNQMLIFKITAEKTPGFDPKVLSLYKLVVKEATAQIEDLGNITSINESSIHESIAPKGM